ncbi:L domain-like protein, partial [Rhizoclosmatium globosum]
AQQHRRLSRRFSSVLSSSAFLRSLLRRNCSASDWLASEPTAADRSFFSNWPHNLKRAFAEIASPSKLHIGFSRCELSGAIPDEIGALLNLLSLCLDHNELAGSLPPSLSLLSNLKSLNCSNNDIEGPIPVEIGNLALRPIPASIGNLSSLKKLMLTQNCLSGSIPPEIGALSRLNTLSLSHNFLTGPIPPEIGLLESLQFCKLSFNNLTGSIPPEIGRLVRLHGTVFMSELWSQLYSEFTKCGTRSRAELVAFMQGH